MSAYSDLTKLILWCRKNGIVWTTLTAGSMTIDGGDTKLRGDDIPKAATVDVTPNMWKRYGGDLLKEAADSEGMTSIVEED